VLRVTTGSQAVFVPERAAHNRSVLADSYTLRQGLKTLIAASKLLDPSKTLTLLKDVGEVAATGSTRSPALYEWVWLLRVSPLLILCISRQARSRRLHRHLPTPGASTSQFFLSLSWPLMRVVTCVYDHANAAATLNIRVIKYILHVVTPYYSAWWSNSNSMKWLHQYHRTIPSIDALFNVLGCALTAMCNSSSPIVSIIAGRLQPTFSAQSAGKTT
jgi:hypothetical protein